MTKYDKANEALMNLCGGKANGWLDFGSLFHLSPLIIKREVAKVKDIIFKDIAFNGWNTPQEFIDFKTVMLFITELEEELKE